MTMRHRMLLSCTLVLTAAPHSVEAQSASARPDWQLSGSFLNILSRSRTVLSPETPFTLDLSRLRLRLTGSPVSRITLDVQDDNELLFGSYLRTEQYTRSKDRIPTTSLDLDHEYFAGRSLVIRHRLYRAAVSWRGARTDVKIGRQRIPLGTGQFWSPMDLLNPIDPTRLERDYRSGVDAVLVERKLGTLARLDAVYVPATSRVKSIVAAYLHANTRGTDYSILLGRLRGDDAVGVDFSTRRGGMGIRGEGTLTRPSGGSSHVRALLGADYGFANTLNLTAEFYYNGQGTSAPSRYDLPSLFAGRILNVGRYYSAVATSYQFTPLMKAASYVVFNAGDRSGVIWPRLEYSLSTNLDVAGGLQRFFGGQKSEYGRFSNLAHAELRWFF